MLVAVPIVSKTVEVAASAELIIAIVYLPILFLEGTEGKLFRPMALTVLFALAGSLIISLTLMPVLAAAMPRCAPLLVLPLESNLAPQWRCTPADFAPAA